MTEAQRIAAAYGNAPSIQGGNPVIQGGAAPLQGGTPNIQPAGPAAPKPAPVVKSSPAPGSLKGTMTTPAAPAAPAAPVAAPQRQQAPRVDEGTGSVDSYKFSQYLSTMQDKLKANNDLAEIRGKLITALYDRPLTDEEKSTLPPSMLKSLESGDKRDIDLQIRLLNDQIKGRTGTLDQSVKFLADEYKNSLELADKQRQDAINNIVNFSQVYGSGTAEALRSLYGDEYINKLKQMGIDIDAFSSPETLAEYKLAQDAQQSSGLTAAQINSTVNSIRSAFRNEQIVKDYNTTANKYQSVKKIIEGGSGGPQDLAVIFEFMKGLDPTSVVRESEYATAANSGNIFLGALAKFNGYFKKEGGRLPENVKKEFLNILNSKFSTAKTQYDNLAAEYQRQIDDAYSGNPTTLIDYGGAFDGGGGSNDDPLGLGFSSVGKTSASKPYLSTLGSVTGENGSSLWKYGLDVDLKIGDPVLAPSIGKVIAVGPNGGFGNQVKIKLADGNEVWLSHLSKSLVKVGDTVRPGQKIALGGNTGNTIPGKGGDGSHLDITIKDKNGKLLSAPQVHKYLNNKFV